MTKLTFKALATAVAITAATTLSAHSANIVKTAASTGKFNTLLAAAKAAGLVGTLGHTRGITVFAPTDAAFARLPKGTVQDLLKPKNRHKLAAILKYHVIPGRVLARDVPRKSTHIRTLKARGDRTIRVRKRFGRVRVDNARVIQADVKASNGVIHVINRVLLPSS
ncbi:fasciclin domain-containing protein [Pseudahrensia aquimaris]|uniref:Fasciclin domain-containing protein n=1 Tax=Pseudahrensia aquimaris TaxID=744461 RepID=A0ABW3FE37_9HYPH